MSRLRVAVVGHVEHITLGRVRVLPKEGDIVHLDSPIAFPGGGGGVTFYQLLRSSAEVVLYTALGNDDAAAFVEQRIRETGARIHAARRQEPHTRDLVLVTEKGERTIIVIGEPLHPRRTDALQWDELAACDAVYFTAQDPDALVAARQARNLVVTARRRHVLEAAQVRADVVIGSAHDPREATVLDDYPIRPGALVMTEGARGGRVDTESGSRRFEAAEARAGGGSYGAGDSFAGAVTYHLAAGLDPFEAAKSSARFGAAVLAGLDPLAHQLEL